MADLISPTTASFKIKTGLISSPTADLACTGEVSVSSEAETYDFACLGAIVVSRTIGAKTINCSFSGKLDDADAAPVDHIGETGLHTGGPCSIIIDWGDTSDTTLTMSGYLISFETSVGGDAASYSGEIAVTSSP